MNKESYSSLQSAHKGYEYQDLIVAIGILNCITQNWDYIRVDKKSFEGDSFDDFVVFNKGKINKFQIKHSSNRVFRLKDISNSNTGYLLEDIAVSITKDRESLNSEYHLTTNWNFQDEMDGIVTTRKSLPMLDLPCKSFKIDLKSISDNNTKKNINKIKKKLKDLGFCESIDFRNLTLHSDLPNFTSDLTNPGELEKILFRVAIESVGIGKYPYKNRGLVDFAAMVIKLATNCRTNQREIFKSEIEQKLQLKADLGSLPNKIEIDELIVQHRTAVQNKIIDKLDESKVHILLGAPGTGKSWVLSLLKDNLSSHECIVGKHHCYITPVDEDPRLATAEVAIANLVSDLISSDEILDDALKTKYAVDYIELERIIEAASGNYKKVVLIVDGLDHIPRLLKRYPQVTPVDTLIFESIAKINLPSNAVIIFGTQPGTEFDGILKMYKDYKPVVHRIPEWKPVEISKLFVSYGVKEHIGKSITDVDKLIDLTVNKSEGNPLYATYIIKSIFALISEGRITSIEKELKELPFYQDDINNYYSHILSSSGDFGVAVARLVAAIPFGVSASEILEILGGGATNKAFVDKSLKLISPLLAGNSDFSGNRIFHESFRRYVLEEYGSADDARGVFDDVARWLKSLNYYRDSRAYSFLIKVLINSSKPEKIFEVVEPLYLEKSFEAGFNFNLIQENLKRAINFACDKKNWPFIIRIVELNRALYNAEFNGFESSFDFWEFGVHSLNESTSSQKLISEGLPYYSKYEGLRFCKMYHENGLVAPWDIYLELEEDKSDFPNNSTQKEHKQELSNLIIYGNCCIGNTEEYYKKTIKFLHKTIPEYNSVNFYGYVKDIILTFKESNDDTKYLKGIFESIKSIYLSGNKALRDDVEELLFYCAKLENSLWSDQTLSNILIEIESEEDLSRALIATSYNAKVGIRDGVFELASNWETEDRHEPDDLEDWLLSMDILVSNSDVNNLVKVANSIPTDCWFNNWKKFCVLIRLTTFEENKLEKIKNYLSAYSLLSNEVGPFVGEIRSCDLYPFRDLICKEVINPLEKAPDKKTCLRSLVHVCDAVTNQTTIIQNSPFSPINPETIARRFLKLKLHTENRSSVSYYARWLKRLADNTGSYPEFYRDWYAASAALYKHSGLLCSSKRVWKLVSKFVFGYGFRKDVTYYELLSSIGAITFADKEKQEKDIISLQNICDRVVKHTDGRSTSRAAIDWLDSVSSLDLKSAALCLSNSFNNIEPYGWYLDEASINIASKHFVTSPQLRAAILMCIPYEEREIEHIKFAHLSAEIESIKKLNLVDSKSAKEFGAFLVSKLQGHSGKAIDNQLRYVKKEFDDCGIPFPEIWKINVENDPFVNSFHTKENSKVYEKFRELDDLRNLSVNNIKPENLIHLINNIDSLKYDLKISRSKISNLLGYAFIEIFDNLGEGVAIELLQYLKRKSFYSLSNRDSIFEDLGNGFLRYGKEKIAVFSYLAAMERSINSYSFSNRQNLLDGFSRAYKIDPEYSIECLCEIIKESFQDLSYGFGWTSSIVNVLNEIGLDEQAYLSWRSSKSIIDRRLPVGKVPQHFSKFQFAGPEADADTLMAQIFLAHFKNPELFRRYSSYKLLSIMGDHEFKAIDAGLLNYLSSSCSIFNIRIIICLILANEKLGANEKLISLLQQYTLSNYGVISLLVKKIISSKEVIEIGANSFLHPPPNIKSFWVTEGYVSDYCPGLKKGYVSQLESLKSLCKHKEYSEQRYQRSYHRTDPEGELTPVVLWHLEIFELALDKALDEAIKLGWRNGWVNSRKINEITNDIYFLTCFDLSLGLMLNPRPCIELPSVAKDAVSEILPLDNGWIRASVIELERQIAWNRHANGQKSFLSIRSIVPSVNAGDDGILDQLLPVKAPLYWFKELYGLQEYVVGSPVFNVLKLGNLIFDVDVVVLSNSLMRLLNLRQEKPYDFKWYDADDNLVAYANVWFERDPLAYNDNRPGLVGSELLINRWLYEEIKKVNGELSSVRNISSY